MEPSDQNPSAQGTDAAVPQDEQGAEVGRQLGVEKRINELTAKMYAAQEASARKDEQILALTSKMTDFMSRAEERSRPREEALAIPESLDQSAAAYLETRIQQIEAKYEQRLAQTEAQMHSGAAASAAAQLAQRFNIKDVGQANAIAQRAADLAAGWRAKGLPFAPSDAADFAFMEHLKSQGPVRGQSSFAAPQYAVTQGAGPIPSYAPAKPKNQLPANFDSLSSTKQLELLDAMDDQPL